jgi:hypothetical protein
MLKSALSLLLVVSVASCGGQIRTENGNTILPQKDEMSLTDSTPLTFNAKENADANDMQRAIAKVMGAHFQSCAPILFPSQDVKSNLNRYFRSKESYTTNNCTDRRDDDLRYVSFGKGSLDPNAGLLHESDGKIDALARFNCSGFVAATMSAGGLKYYKGQTSKFYSPRTHEIEDVFKKSDTCFFKPTLNKSRSILPGDILNVSHSHTIRVLSVGVDPLGLGQVEKKSDCDKISRKDLNFTYAHSTSRDKTEGVTGVRAELAKEPGPAIIENLVGQVKKMCRDKFERGDVEGIIADAKVGEKEFAGGLIRKDQIFALRRHFGPSKDGCSFSAPEVKGGRCISDECYTKISN